MKISLLGKVALVTGAAQGIGKAIALELAKSGAAVAVNDISDNVTLTKREIDKMNRRSLATIFDVAIEQEVETAVRDIRAKLGSIDILVNNVGITNNIASILEMTKERWDREMAVNLGGAYNCTRAVLPSMIKAKWGRIIMISSLGAAGLHYQVGYACSKAGMAGLAKTVALEHSKDGITCNVILCGVIGSPLVLAMPDEIRMEFATERTPAGRIGDVEDVAHAVVFLASEQAKYITGSELYVDGGTHLNTFSFAVRHLTFGTDVDSSKDAR
jgi:NAD(P)-dependent dehydrogenase (short-subunit alcohol dehydrogenase family)